MALGDDGEPRVGQVAVRVEQREPIPNTVLIDRQGQLVYLGQFETALEQAARSLTAEK